MSIPLTLSYWIMAAPSYKPYFSSCFSHFTLVSFCSTDSSTFLLNMGAWPLPFFILFILLLSDHLHFSGLNNNYMLITSNFPFLIWELNSNIQVPPGIFSSPAYKHLQCQVSRMKPTLSILPLSVRGITVHSVLKPDLGRHSWRAFLSLNPSLKSVHCYPLP